MMLSEAKEFVSAWSMLDSKVFEWHVPMWPTEYVTIYRSLDGYKQDTKNSTLAMPIKEWDKDKMIEMLCKKDLVFYSLYNAYTNVKEMKTNGCECGAYSLTENHFKHATWCPRYRNPHA